MRRVFQTFIDQLSANTDPIMLQSVMTEAAAAPHRHYFNKITQVTIRPARKGYSPHDSYSPGDRHRSAF
jgi:hypothetical protein